MAGLCAAATARAQVRVTFLHTPPRSAQGGQDLEIAGNLFGAGDVDKARVVHRGIDAAWQSESLLPEYGDVWRAVLPGARIYAPHLEYFVVAQDFDGRPIPLFGSERRPQRVAVVGGRRPPAARRSDPAASPQGPNEFGPSRAPPVAVKPSERRPPEPEPEPPPPEAEAAPAPAKERDEELALFGAEDVVTLATRQAQTVTEAPAIATGISEDQLKALGARILPDALKVVPGMDTSRDVQGFWRVAIRGLRADPEVLVLYDGHRLNNPYDGRAPLALGLENVERVEVIRGPGSALYGTGAFLGVVNVVPRRREELGAAVRLGAFETVDVSAAGGRKAGSISVFGDLSWRRSAGYRRAIDKDALAASLLNQGLLSEGDPVGLTNDRHCNVNAGGEIRFAATRADTVVLSARLLNEGRGALLGPFDAAGDGRLDWRVVLADLKAVHRLETGRLQARLYFDVQDETRTFQLAPPGLRIAAIQSPSGVWETTSFGTVTLGAEGSIDVDLVRGNRLTVGLLVEQPQLTGYRYESNLCGSRLCAEQGLPEFTTPPGLVVWQELDSVRRRTTVGLHVQDLWRLAPPLTLTAGLRFDGFVLPAPDAACDPTVSRCDPTVSRFVPSVNPRVGLVWSPGGGFSLKALYGRAFRAPTIQELAERIPSTELSQGRFEGNPALRAPTIDTIELAAEWLGAVGEARVRVRGNAFFTHVSDPISPVDTSGNIVPLQNRAKGVVAVGAEGEVRFEVSTRAFTAVNCSWVRAMDMLLEPSNSIGLVLAAGVPRTDLLTDVPQVRFNWVGQIPIGPYLNLSVVAMQASERRNNVRSVLESLRPYRIPSYVLVNAQLRTEPLLWGMVELALQVQNAFDYDLRDDVPRPDRVPGLLPREGAAIYGVIRVKR